MRHYIKFMLLGGTIFALPLFVFAVWTSPTASPPSNNTDAPLNVGSVTQTKSGSLNSNGDVRGARLCIGADCRTSWPSSGESIPDGTWCGRGHETGTYSESAGPDVLCDGNNPRYSCPAGYLRVNYGIDSRQHAVDEKYWTCIKTTLSPPPPPQAHGTCDNGYDDNGDGWVDDEDTSCHWDYEQWNWDSYDPYLDEY